MEAIKIGEAHMEPAEVLALLWPYFSVLLVTWTAYFGVLVVSASFLYFGLCPVLGYYLPKLYNLFLGFWERRALRKQVRPDARVRPVFVDGVVCYDVNGPYMRVDIADKSVYVRLSPLQLAQMIPVPSLPSVAREAVLPSGFVSVNTQPKGVLSLVVSGHVVGMASRVVIGESTYLLTAMHVLSSSIGHEVLMTYDGKSFVLDPKWKMTGFSKVSDFDFCLVQVPSSVWSVLGVPALRVKALPNEARATVYGLSQLGEWVASMASLTASKSPFLIEHTCSTIPSFSGTPIIVDGKVCGVHTHTNNTKNFGTALSLLLRRESEGPRNVWVELPDAFSSDEEPERVNFYWEDNCYELSSKARQYHLAIKEVPVALANLSGWADYEDSDDDFWATESVVRESALNGRGPLSPPCSGPLSMPVDTDGISVRQKKVESDLETRVPTKSQLRRRRQRAARQKKRAKPSQSFAPTNGRPAEEKQRRNPCASTLECTTPSPVPETTEMLFERQLKDMLVPKHPWASTIKVRFCPEVGEK